MSRRPSPACDDRGTSLILALVFVFVIGHGAGSRRWSGRKRTAEHDQRSGRTDQYGDADAAVTIAMQYLRYNPAPDPVVAPSCLPPSSTIPSSDPAVNSDNPVQVVCTLAVDPTSSETRVVDFYACPTGVSQSACDSTATLLHAQVAYNDLNADGIDDCYTALPVAVTTSCGTEMNVDLWDVIGADT